MIHGDDPLSLLCEELCEGSLTCSEVGNDLEIKDFEESLSQCFPRSSRNVVPSKFASEFVKIGPGAVLPLVENVLQGGEIPVPVLKFGPGPLGNIQ